MKGSTYLGNATLYPIQNSSQEDMTLGKRNFVNVDEIKNFNKILDQDASRGSARECSQAIVSGLFRKIVITRDWIA